MLIPPEINIFTHYSKIQFLSKLSIVKLKNGGENGIRTHERVSPLHAFQACAFNHSACLYLLYLLIFFEISGFKFSDDNTTTRLFSFF